MKIDLIILNKENKTEPFHNESPTWHSRTKSYESDWWDKDIVESTIGYKLDRIIMNNVQLSSKTDIDHIIEFLQQAKESF